MEFLVVLIPLLIVTLVAYLFWASHKRQKELIAEAARLGLEFSQRDPEGLARAYRKLQALSGGSNPKVRNVLSGTYRGRAVRCFDFSYQVQHGKNRSTHNRGVAMVQVPEAWPQVSIVPETWAHKIADALGMEDIDFESDEFSRKFWVRASDRKFAYDLLHPRAMEYLLTPGISRWEIRGGILCVWADSLFTPSDVAPILDRLVGFLELVPAHVLARTTAPTGGAP